MTTFDRYTVFQDRHSLNLLAEKIGFANVDILTDMELVQLILNNFYAPEDRDTLRPIYERILTTDLRRRLLCRGELRQ